MAVFTDYKDGVAGSALSATPASFTLLGGKYRVSVSATFGGGSVELDLLMPDGSTYQAVGTTTTFTAAGSVAIDLPAGTYRFAIATATAVVVSVAKVPYQVT